MSPRKPARTRASSRTTASIDAYGFSRTKSAVHFTADAPLPAALVRKLLRARLAELPRTTKRRS